ncbi:MAG: hypothetical protein ACXVC0_12780 [Bdellovibrionota bacterium]
MRVLPLEYIPIILLSPLIACTVAPSSALNNGHVVNYTTCSLPKDQGVGSLHGAWATLPVNLVLDKDFYVADDGAAVPSLRESVQSWNTWAGIRGLGEAFNLKNDGSGQSAGLDIPELTDCSQASYSASLPGTVGVWKIASAGFHANRRASCGTAADGSPGKLLSLGVQGQTDWIIQNGRITGASVLLNFEDYNSPGKQPIDVQSLLLHELGHVLGLLHSCNGSSGGSIDGTTAPACFTAGVLTAPTEYTNAVMFPFLQVGQIRQSLTQNDYNRINCLY